MPEALTNTVRERDEEQTEDDPTEPFVILESLTNEGLLGMKKNSWTANKC